MAETTIFTQMRARRIKNNIARFVSCIFMMLALAWLTISLPIVYSAQQVALEKKAAKTDSPQTEEEASNTFGNTTEEKTAGNSNSLSEEYLHEAHTTEHFTTELSIEYRIEHFSTYIAFYGDLESPPPDQA